MITFCYCFLEHRSRFSDTPTSRHGRASVLIIRVFCSTSPSWCLWRSAIAFNMNVVSKRSSQATSKHRSSSDNSVDPAWHRCSVTSVRMILATTLCSQHKASSFEQLQKLSARNCRSTARSKAIHMLKWMSRCLPACHYSCVDDWARFSKTNALWSHCQSMDYSSSADRNRSEDSTELEQRLCKTA